MTAQGKIKDGDKVKAPTGLELLRAPFPANQISKLPKPTEHQTKEVKQDFKKGIRCKLCGGWHHPQVVHLDYVGHAALTDRLLDSDPEWNWEPVATNEDGTPKTDQLGGMWIRLTVCGVTRLGYGDAQGKKGPNAIKELIGDALRNAAMRFGAALDLWHKGDLHGVEEPTEGDAPHQEESQDNASADHNATATRIKTAINRAATAEALTTLWTHKATVAAIADLPDDIKAEVQHDYDVAKRALAEDAKHDDAVKEDRNGDLGGDEIPY